MRGKVCEIIYVYVRRWDHPRLCGEKLRPVRPHIDAEGSPPPMRGKAAARDGAYTDPRITPAYAGKRQNANLQFLRHQDHPRLCGEKLQRCRLP